MCPSYVIHVELSVWIVYWHQPDCWRTMALLLRCQLYLCPHSVQNDGPYFRSAQHIVGRTQQRLDLTLTKMTVLQPLRVPGFAFAWLELISHRNLMPKLLLAPNHKGWLSFQRLLLALLKFLEPYLRNAELTDAVRLLYKVINLLKELQPGVYNVVST